MKLEPIDTSTTAGKAVVMNSISHASLLAAVIYDAETGIFYRKGDGRRIFKRLKRAGTARKDGYRHIGLGGQNYLEHRVAFFYVHGRWPYHEVDHIDGDRSNNRIVNLRECTASQNHQNAVSHADAKSKFLGVSWHKGAGKWQARIKYGGSEKHLGLFNDELSASNAYLQAKENHHIFQPTPRVSV